MRRVFPASSLLLLAAACQTGGGIGSTNPGWEFDDDPFAVIDDNASQDVDDEPPDPGTDLRTAGLSVEGVSCDTSEEDVEQALIATVDGTAVTLEHTGVGTWCDAEWGASANIYGSGLIEVRYTDSSGLTAETADCWCHWTLSYTVTDLTAGDWTASAPQLDDSTDFTVE